MVTPQRPGGPRDERGPLAWATAVNDSTQEWVAASARILAVLWALVTSLMLLFLAVQPGWNIAAATVIAAVNATGWGWLGFRLLANPEWKEAADDGDAD